MSRLDGVIHYPNIAMDSSRLIMCHHDKGEA
jgi:hypothetical protein